MTGCVEFLQANVADSFALFVSDCFCYGHSRFLSWLLADSNPGHLSIPGFVARGLLGEVEHLDAIVDRNVASAQAGDKVRNHRPVLRGIETGSNFVEQDAAIIRGAVRKIPINHTDDFEALQALSQFECWEGAEPAQIDIADFLPLLPQPPRSRASCGGDLTQTDQDNFGIVGHELCEIGRSVPLSKDRVEFLVGFFDDAARSARSLPILPSKFHHPILVDLWRYGNRVVGM